MILIVLAALVAGLFVHPKFFGENVRPWRLGLDLVGGSHLVYEIDLAAVEAADRGSVVNGVRDVIERRVNLFGVSEPQIFSAKSGTEKPQLIVELAGIDEVGEAIKLIGETPLLNFAEFDEIGLAAAELPLPVSEACNVPPKSILVLTNLTGRYITSAQVVPDPTTRQPRVALAFNSDGEKIFGQLTEKNVGKPIATFLDNQLITCPVVQEKITGGQAVITGSFTFEEARTLAERFNAGALPAPINLISQQTVSASLGTGSLNKVIFAGILGTLLVALFMIVYYRRFGIFAALALIIYIAFTLAAFKLISITMTLAGIAGFILTIGMAVDANILIFERIKEELKRGLSKSSAVEEGFRRAWLSIRDSNVSTIITAVILFYFTSSFVKGFALALLIGTLISMFSAITTTKLFLRVFSRDAKPLPTTH